MLKFLKENIWSVMPTIILMWCLYRIESNDLGWALVFGYAAIFGLLEHLKVDVKVGTLSIVKRED